MGGNRVFTGHAPESYAIPGVRRNCGPVMKHASLPRWLTYRRSAANTRSCPKGDRQVCLLPRHVGQLAREPFRKSPPLIYPTVKKLLHLGFGVEAKRTPKSHGARVLLLDDESNRSSPSTEQPAFKRYPQSVTQPLAALAGSQQKNPHVPAARLGKAIDQVHHSHKGSGAFEPDDEFLLARDIGRCDAQQFVGNFF